MPNFNFLFFLNTYSDSNPSNNPSQNNFKWTRNINGLAVDNPISQELSLAPGETAQLFNGTRTLAQDNTTQYSVALKALTLNTYVLSWASGTQPNFRTPRAPGADATTQVTVTQNGPVLTFASSGGTAFSLISGGVVVGDYVRLGNLFNVANQGEYKVIAVSATSLSVENETGVAEGPITLGSGFADQFQVYSAAGVQINDTLVISGGFSPVTQGAYKVTAVGANFLEFFSADVLPQESNIQTQAVALYSAAKQFVYLEADSKCAIMINGVSGNEIEPFVVNQSVVPGVFARKSTMWSMSVTNSGTDVANLFFAAIE
jgi:hypothetical protein